MKFAKELEEDLVPEWRDKYLDYKQGKKKVKAVERAVRGAQKSPKTPSAWRSPGKRGVTDPLAPRGPDTSPPTQTNGTAGGDEEVDTSSDNGSLARTKSVPIAVPTASHPRDGEAGNGETFTSDGGTHWTRYGSIIGSPPSRSTSRPGSLNLGDPAIDTNDTHSDEGLLDTSRGREAGSQDTQDRLEAPQQDRSMSGPSQQVSAFEVGRTSSPARPRQLLGLRHVSDPGGPRGNQSLLGPNRRASEMEVPFKERINPRHLYKRSLSSRHAQDGRPHYEDPLFKRMFSRHGPKALAPTDVPLEAWQELHNKQDEFWDFLDGELKKIEDFYKQKEDEATSRLNTLKRQLHMLRDHHLQEINEKRREVERRRRKHSKNPPGVDSKDDESSDDLSNGHHFGRMAKDAVFHPIQSAKQVQFRGTPQVLGEATPPTKTLEDARDYIRRPAPSDQKSYVGAKRKLKRALQEFYRGLELLKSYALLNRTAFRKINKKFDKAVNPTKKMAYQEKVKNACFVKSSLVDDYIEAIEDLYARYFYNANRKVAASKLRSKNRLPDAYIDSVFRNGLALGFGTILAVEAVVKAGHLFYDNETSNPGLATLTSYVMQIYAGYFLLLLLVLIFCLDCRIFHHAKVNYVFIFEFDTRHNLDWRQLAELPCLFYLLMGLIMYLNFTNVGGYTMYHYWPIVLIGITLAVLFLPLPTVYHESRKWFLTSLGRLLVPWFPVEFRDFFLGDMLCSETYSTGGIALFFCLYDNYFTNPSQCNSSNSRLFGFFQTLPGIIRLLQCCRRLYDTGQWFPHAANGGKYICTILQYASLSVFRIDKSVKTRAFFIVCATINGLATSTWDLAIDWSLLDPYAKHRFLRTRLAYKQVWWYYAAMIIDPILRFNWIFYAIPFFSDEIQHTTLLGFLIALTEVFRRGIWTLFRVENEHCTNVGKFKASRDVELPYALTQEEEEAEEEHLAKSLSGSIGARRPSAHAEGFTRPTPPLSGSPYAKRRTSPPSSVSPTALSPASRANTYATSGAGTGVDVEAGRPPKSPAHSLLRRRQNQQGITPSIPSPGQGLLSRVGTMLQGAHAQDFERKRRPSGHEADGGSRTGAEEYKETDDDDEEDEDEGGDGVGDGVGEVGGSEESEISARARARRALSSVHATPLRPTGIRTRSDRLQEAENEREVSDAVGALRRGRGEDGEEPEEVEEVEEEDDTRI